MLNTVAPLTGWVLDCIVDLDRYAPGFAGRCLRASAERRQVIAAFLAASPVENTDPALAREAADFLNRANHRAILHLGFGSVPAGFRGALARSGSQPHQPRFYTLLHQTLSRPAHAHIVPVIQHLPALDLMKLRVAHLLPAGICTASMVSIIDGPRAARDVTQALDLLIGTGVDREGLSQAMRRVSSAKELTALWKRWSLRTVFGKHPVPSSAQYRPVTTADELRQLARRYRNCAERYVAICLNSFAAFAEFRSGERGVVVHLRRREAGWIVQDLFGKHNAFPDPDIRSEAMAYLLQHGVSSKLKARTESGNWAVLQRLCSQGLFDFQHGE